MKEWTNIIKRTNIQQKTKKNREHYQKKIINYNLNRKHKRLSKCGWCGKQYIKKANKQKYCSEECRKDARGHQSRMKSHKWYHRHKHELTEKQRWGLGSSTIGQHRHQDYEKEQKVITRELQRLGLNKKKYK